MEWLAQFFLKLPIHLHNGVLFGPSRSSHPVMLVIHSRVQGNQEDESRGGFMSNLVRRLVASSILLGSFGLTGCQYHSKKDVYYLISNNLKLPYWKTVNSGFAKAAAEYGVTAQLEGPDTYDPQAETDAFTKAASYHPAGILVSVADANLMRPAINSAIEAGVPVITVDSDAPLSSRLYFIGTNNLSAGHLGGQRLVDKLHGKGTSSSTRLPANQTWKNG
jgi:ABC-type sugar transport system substrate-binding protein